MSPLIAAPSRGYADYQRLENFDSGVLYSQAPNNTVATFTSGVLDMSRYAYMGGFITCSLALMTFTVGWYADEALTIPLAGRTFVVQQSMLHGAQIRLPNLGPFAVITLAGIPAQPYTGSVEIIGTNRVHPLEFIPQNPQLITADGVAVGAGVQLAVNPVDYYAGPVRIQFRPFFSTASLELKWQDGTGAVWTIDIMEQGVASGNYSLQSVTIPGYWFALVTNGSAGASTFNLHVTGSMTGSL